MSTVDWAKLTDSGSGATRVAVWARVYQVDEPATHTFTCHSTLGTPRSEYICAAYRNATLGSYQLADGSSDTATPPSVPDPPGSSGKIVAAAVHRGFVSFSSGTGTARADVPATTHAYTSHLSDIAHATGVPPHNIYSGSDVWWATSVALHAALGAVTFEDVTSGASGASTIPRAVSVPGGARAGDLMILLMAYDTPTGVIDLIDDGTSISPEPGTRVVSINHAFGLDSP